MIQPKKLLIMAWLLLLAGCVSQPQAETSSLKSASVFSPFKSVTSFPPPELADAFNRERCADYCWQGIILGQPEEEAISLVRSDPLTDKTIQPWGDYLGVQHYESIYGDIGWNMLLPYESDDLVDGHVHTINGVVDYFVVPIQHRFPVEVLLQSTLGLPDYVALPILGVHGGWAVEHYQLAYSEQRIEFRSPETHRLTPDRLINRVIFYTQSPNYKCSSFYYDWSIMEQDRLPVDPRIVASDCE